MQRRNPAARRGVQTKAVPGQPAAPTPPPAGPGQMNGQAIDPGLSDLEQVEQHEWAGDLYEEGDESDPAQAYAAFTGLEGEQAWLDRAEDGSLTAWVRDADGSVYRYTDPKAWAVDVDDSQMTRSDGAPATAGAAEGEDLATDGMDDGPGGPMTDPAASAGSNQLPEDGFDPEADTPDGPPADPATPGDPIVDPAEAGTEMDPLDATEDLGGEEDDPDAEEEDDEDEDENPFKTEGKAYRLVMKAAHR